MDVINIPNEEQLASPRLIRLMVLDNPNVWWSLISCGRISKALLNSLEKVKDYKALSIIRSRGIQEFDYPDDFLIPLINDFDNYEAIFAFKRDELSFNNQYASLKQTISENVM